MSKAYRQQINNLRDRAGIALIVVLWVLVMLAVLVVALARNTRLDNAVRMAGGDRVTARWLARAGVNRIISEIARDTSPTDWSGESWYDDEKLFREVAIAGGAFTLCADRFYVDNNCAYGATDEASKVNLNTATVEMLLALPEMTENLALAIIRWRQEMKESQDRQDGFAARQGAGQFPMDGAFDTVRELALVADEVTLERLYGEDGNLNGILEDNENDGDESPPTDNKDGVLDRGLLAYVTVYSYELNRDGSGQDRININTASWEKLEEELQLSPEYARWIVENRPYSNSIADLLEEGESGTSRLEETAEKTPSAATQTAGPALADTKETVETAPAAEAKMASVRPNGEIFRRIADRITITDDKVIPGRININTADRLILQALPGMNEQLVEQIVKARQEKLKGFTSIGELLTVPRITVKHFKKLAPLIAVRSNVFTIRSCGQAQRTGIRHYIEAVVSRGPEEPTVLYWKESK